MAIHSGEYNVEMRSVTKRHFDLFLNYFQDKSITHVVGGSYYYDTYDNTLLAKRTPTGYFIND